MHVQAGAFWPQLLLPLLPRPPSAEERRWAAQQL